MADQISVSLPDLDSKVLRQMAKEQGISVSRMASQLIHGGLCQEAHNQNSLVVWLKMQEKRQESLSVPVEKDEE